MGSGRFPPIGRGTGQRTIFDHARPQVLQPGVEFLFNVPQGRFRVSQPPCGHSGRQLRRQPARRSSRMRVKIDLTSRTWVGWNYPQYPIAVPNVSTKSLRWHGS